MSASPVHVGDNSGCFFLAVFSNTSTSAAEALLIGQRIREAIALSSGRNPDIPRHTVSIGTATMLPGAYADRDCLIKRADQALLQAKRNGRNQIVQAEVE
ncbi:diguanylate cyclase domain-containing protein [Propionispora vibrioides]|uniref:diguanylate cyclase domain-containing protein n=1 Tax=Propionispora vibrioides TaxID=112903 RepID=UPI000B8207A2